MSRARAAQVIASALEAMTTAKQIRSEVTTPPESQ
jgi:hypothetical protein